MDVSYGTEEGTETVTPLPETPAPTSGGVVYDNPTDAHPESTAVTVRRQSGPLAANGGMVLGDRLPSFDNVILPRLNIVQGMGQLKDTFQQGALIFGQSSILFTPPILNKATGVIAQAALPPAVVTVLGFRPDRFVEKVPYGTRGAICSSEDEVRACGGTLDYREWKLKEKDGMKRFEPLAEAVCLVRRPEHLADDDTVFIFDVDGHKYALALWALKGASYTAAVKSVFSTARLIGCLRKEGYPSWSYNVTTRLKPFDGGKSCWIPICVPNAKNTPAFIDFVAGILNPQAIADDSAE